MLKRVILSLALLMNSVLPANVDAGINSLIDDFKSQTKCGNVSVVVCDHGDLSYYGDSEGLYQIGSMTKSFTGLAVQKLMDGKVISGDDKVSDLIPGFTAYYDSSVTDITVTDLLMQRSGFTNNETDYPSATEDMTLKEWAESISGKELKSRPGTEYSYSNVNYNLLGLIIENVTGLSYREYMESEVLEPMGLESTSAGMPDETNKIIRGSRIGFRTVWDYEVPVREGSIPAGYFYSNTGDIGKWMSQWIEGGQDMDAVMSHLQEKGDYYAGWERFEDDVTGHSGGTPNYSSRIVFSRSRGIGVCVLTNLNVAATTDSLCNSIFDEVSGKGHGKISCDVWTVFDIIFTLVTVAGTALIVVAIVVRKKGALVSIGAASALLLILMLILFPVIFGAGIKEITFTWAPVSLAFGFAVLAAAAVTAFIKFGLVRIDEGRAKTG